MHVIDVWQRKRAPRHIILLAGCAIGLSLMLLFLLKHQETFVPLPTRLMPPASIP
jgi:hypothetical protein